MTWVVGCTTANFKLWGAGRSGRPGGRACKRSGSRRRERKLSQGTDSSSNGYAENRFGRCGAVGLASAVDSCLFIFIGRFFVSWFGFDVVFFLFLLCLLLWALFCLTWFRYCVCF